MAEAERVEVASVVGWAVEDLVVGWEVAGGAVAMGVAKVVAKAAAKVAAVQVEGAREVEERVVATGEV